MTTEQDETAPVLVTIADHVMLITLNRPEVRNAVNLATTLRIGEALEQAEADTDVRCVVITAAGDKAFCAGSDIKAVARGEANAPSEGPNCHWGFAGFVNHPISKPIVAAVNGPTWGGGTEIVLTCDLAVASESATFAMPEVAIGVYFSGARRMTQQLPKKISLELLLTADPIDANRAREVGLVNMVVAEADVLNAAMAIARRISGHAPLAVQANKRLALGIVDGHIASDDAGLAQAQAEANRLMASRDAAEGISAFAEGREPLWTGE